MGADNWADCPKCGDFNQDVIAAHRDDIEANYGVMSLEEWIEFKGATEAAISKLENDQEQTWAEYYEFWIDEGTLHIKYHGYCTHCGLECEYRDEKEFYQREVE